MRLTDTSTLGAPPARIGGARIVLLDKPDGAAHEHSRERTRITKWLIREHGFSAVAIAGDRHDTGRSGVGRERTHRLTLRDIGALPAWAWHDEELLDLLGWLRAHNDGLHRTARKVTLHHVDPAAVATEAIAAHEQRVVVWTCEAQIADVRPSRMAAPEPIGDRLTA